MFRLCTVPKGMVETYVQDLIRPGEPGSGRDGSASARLNIAQFAPTPMASDNTASQ